MDETTRRGEAGADVNFDRVADEYDVTRGGVERARDAASDLAGHLPAGTVLEVGVGTGIVAEALRGQAPQVERLAGVDISAEMLRRARPRLPGGLVRASAQRLPFADRQFDGVVAVHVLHLVPDLAAMLAEASRVLRPGGRLVAVHGDPDGPDDELSRIVRPLRDLDRGRSDSPAQVRAAAAAVGLRCVAQHPATPRVVRRSPAQVAALVERRSWSRLWEVDDARWRSLVQPVIDELRALPDQELPRVQRAAMTVTALERD